MAVCSWDKGSFSIKMFLFLNFMFDKRNLMGTNDLDSTEKRQNRLPMKKILFILCATLAIASSSNASPFTYYKNDTYYFQVSGSYTMLSDSNISNFTAPTARLRHKDGFGVAAAVGRYYDPVRVEIEYSYRGNRTEGYTVNDVPSSPNVSGNLTYNSLMANVLYEAPLGESMFAYFGGGLGASFVNLEINGRSDMSPTFAYQAMVGLGYNFTRQMSLIFGYRFFSTLQTNHDMKGGTVNVDPAPISGIELGLKINF